MQPRGRTDSEASTWRADPPGKQPMAPQPPPFPLAAFPNIPPFHALTVRGSDFVVHHVCKKCHRPRSLKYHRANPVLPSVPPPPAGICGKCRREEENDNVVKDTGKKATEATKETRVVKEQPSVGHEQVASPRRSRSASPPARSRTNDRISIHLHQTTYSRESPWSDWRVSQQTERVLASADALKERAAAVQEDAGDIRKSRYNQQNTTSVYVQQSYPAPANAEQSTSKPATDQQAAVVHPPLPDQAAAMTRKATSSKNKAATSDRPPSKSDHPRPPVTKAANEEDNKLPSYLYGGGTSVASPRQMMAQAQAAAPVNPLVSKTEAWLQSQSSIPAVSERRVATTNASLPPIAPVQSNKADPPDPSLYTSRTEDSIRRIAREEVIRYRHAERKIEGHPAPVQHGFTTDSARYVPLPAGTKSSAALSAVKPDSVKSQEKDNSTLPDKSSHMERSGSKTVPFYKPATTSKSSEYLEFTTSRVKPIAKENPQERAVSTGKRNNDANLEPAKVSSKEEQRSNTAHNMNEAQQKDRRAAVFPRSYEDVLKVHTSGTTKNTLHHRQSFETELTVHPHSSISQQSPVYFQGEGDVRRPAECIDRILNDAVKLPAHRDEADWTEIRQKVRSEPPRIPPPPPQPRDHAAAFNDNRRAETKYQRGPSDSHEYKDVPSAPPRSPPENRRLSEDERVYEEHLGPDQVRVVRERIVRSMSSSLERESPLLAKRSGRKITRYEIVDVPRTNPEVPRYIPEARGRVLVREGEEKASTQRLQSILRSSSSSREGRNARNKSFKRRVSFSEAIDVAVLSPPVSSSHATSEATSRPSDRRDRGTHSKHAGRGKYDDNQDGNEKYYYQQTRRPAPTEIELAARIPDQKEINRRRALARALSESPSRERGLNLIEESRSRRRRDTERNTQQNGRPAEPGLHRRQTHSGSSSSSRGNPDLGSPTARRPAPSAMSSDNVMTPIAMTGALPRPPARSSAGEQRRDRAPSYADQRDVSKWSPPAPTQGAPRRDGGRVVRRGRDERGPWYEVEYVERVASGGHGAGGYEDGREGRYKW